MKIVDIADQVFQELGEPSTLSIPAISYWLRANVGRLNSAINTSYSVSETTYEIHQKINDKETTISIDAAAILKKMYIVYYYDVQIRANVTGVETDAVVEVSSDGMRVRKTSKTEIIRHLTTLKRLEDEELNRMINFYKTNQAAPRQVAGDDTQAGYFGGDGAIGANYYNRLD
tara:strand:+ start:229 stop:747 length:519 start_codon:yes stop_codon:yes gene_type:complete